MTAAPTGGGIKSNTRIRKYVEYRCLDYTDTKCHCAHCRHSKCLRNHRSARHHNNRIGRGGPRIYRATWTPPQLFHWTVPCSNGNLSDLQNAFFSYLIHVLFCRNAINSQFHSPKKQFSNNNEIICTYLTPLLKSDDDFVSGRAWSVYL